MTNRRKANGLVALGLLTVLPSLPALASEPTNNSFPVTNGLVKGDMEVLVVGSGNSGSAAGLTINSSTDVDYILMSCGQSGRKVSRVQLLPFSADLDLFVYNANNAFLGSSTKGGVQGEAVNVSGTYGTVVAKVVGWAGATSNYTTIVECTNI
jgi:hypothetical protein